MPSDFSFDLKAMRARDEINDALGVMRNQRMNMPGNYQPQPGAPMPSMNVQADPRMQMANLNMPMGGGVSANAQFGGGQNMPYGLQNVGLNYNKPGGFSAGMSYMPQQKAIGANMRVPFQEGGLATSIRNDPVYHDRDVEFLNTRNQRMREVAGLSAYAQGGEVDEIVVQGRRPSELNEVIAFDLSRIGGGGGSSGYGAEPTGGGGGLSASQRIPNLAYVTPKAEKPAIMPAVVRSATSPLAELMGMEAPRGYGAKFSTTFAKGGGAWTRKEGQNPEGGLNAVGRASLKAQGHDIKPPVSAKQAKKSPKAAARRKSFCARMSGMPGPMKDEKGRPTRKALSLRKWDC
jgi:hypothetical protein